MDGIERSDEQRIVGLPETFDDSASWYFGIEHYKTEYQHGLDAITARHGDRLDALAGRVLRRTWVLWDAEDDSWFSDAPVLFDFGNEQLEIQHYKFDELSITWNTIDARSAVRWPESELVWSDDALAGLSHLHGQRVLAGQLLEWRGPDPDLANGMVAVGVVLENGRVLVYNALDENGLDFGQPRPEYRSWSLDTR
ncbi:hypothetical protein [Promicromonospora sp. MEB111]|uniref:hypothetical protein n=1 Tax=unclassified Promicromonospora TaxID=2647929 RepID=UPI00254B7701|nr:hypothetical protein [Promicromonospora sp. MEB111]